MNYYTSFLNCGRNSLRYIIRAFNINEINVPFYTCPSVWQSIKKEGCKIIFYHIDKNFKPTKEFKNTEFILYTNYFGINSKNVIELSNKYKNVIIDNSQAFFMPAIGIASFNSLRKFFKTVDGSFLYSIKKLDKEFETDTSYIDFQNKFGVLNNLNYDLYKNRDFDIENNIKKASELTQNQIINFDKEREDRIFKFELINEYLLKYNELNLKLEKNDIPYVYPLVNKDLTNKYETYWSPQPKNTIEGYFQKYLIPIPIDFRFDKNLFRSSDFYKRILRHKSSTNTI